MLPRRGYPKSRLVTALALLYRSNFWFLVVWGTIGVIVGVRVLASGTEVETPFVVGILLGALVAVALLAALSIVFSRGIIAGNRVVYFLVGIVFFAWGAINALVPLLIIPVSLSAVVGGVSTCIVYGFFGILIFILGAKPAATDG